ncbi:ABC transporter permease [Treponema sp. OMZ 792]|uniref:ABC transporter permease n=1 Tax=unclassified Treponema TaxID=2638727 RepID=UPI0020A23895|nr:MULTISPECIES: ABC transporter permease [unclassified Treponema]UTC74186.1 ABC transporter permease [Treponema sp. OMZ 792]UTC80583.1 FtsX-like permease family protein [Treponema sp. OMZ 798]
MFEDFINALHNFKTNKMRTLLSLLGIVIGVTSVIIVTSLASSLSNSMVKEFEEFSMDIINIGTQRGNPEFGDEEFIKFDEVFRKKLKQKIPEIKRVFYSNRFQAAVVRNNLRIEISDIEGIEAERLESHRVVMDYGSFFSSSDYSTGAEKAIIGDRIAYQLFPEGRAVGKFITLQIPSSGENAPPHIVRLQVIGVVKTKNTWVLRTSDAVFVPRKFAMSKLPGKMADAVWTAEVVIFEPKDTSKVEAKIHDFSEELSGGNRFAIWVYSARQQFEQMNKITGMVGLVLSAIAGISLLVGGIGIMNIMLVTVTERRKEIGIRKALGATGKAIRMQFLIESASLTLTGGLIGIVLGLVISKLIVNFFFPPEIVFLPNFSGSLIAFSVSVCTGIFFGLHPAIKASRLDPVQALAE